MLRRRRNATVFDVRWSEGDAERGFARWICGNHTWLAAWSLVLGVASAADAQIAPAVFLIGGGVMGLRRSIRSKREGTNSSPMLKHMETAWAAKDVEKARADTRLSPLLAPGEGANTPGWGPGELEIARQDGTGEGRWARRDRRWPYRVMVDGTEVGKIKAGESKVFAVRPGPHDLRLWVGTDGHSQSLAFRLRTGERARFVCWKNKQPFGAVPLNDWICLARCDAEQATAPAAARAT